MSQYVLDNVDATFTGYQKLIDLYEYYKSDPFVPIELNIKDWFGANLCSALGGVLDKLVDEGIRFNSTINADPSIREIIQKNEFLSSFGYDSLYDKNHTTIKYLKLKPTDGRFFTEYVMHDFLEHTELSSISIELKRKIVESISEMFVNAQTHSKSKYIYTCGQFYPIKKKIEFTITDTGVGFKSNANKKFNVDLTAEQAIRWSTGKGHTTKTGTSGGIGLALLKEFITKNKSKLQIISDDGFYEYSGDNGKEWTKTFTNCFPGTIINMQFKTDDNNLYYSGINNSVESIF